MIAFLLITAAVAAFCVQYPLFRENAVRYKVNILQSDDFLTDLYKGNAVLYRELSERAAEKSVRYRDVFLHITEEPGDWDVSYVGFGGTWSKLAGDTMDSMMEGWEEQVRSLDGIAQEADYRLIDKKTGASISNTGKAIDKLGTDEADDELKEFYPYYIRMSFNENGYLEHVWVKGENSDELLKAVQNAMRSKFLSNHFWERSYFGNEGESLYYHDGSQGWKAETTVYNGPRNCVVCYAFSHRQMENLLANNSWRNWYIYFAYSGACGSANLLLALLAAAAFLLPLWGRYTLHTKRWVQVPLEISIGLLFAMSVGSSEWMASLVHWISEGVLADAIGLQKRWAAEGIAWGINVVVLYLLFGIWYYLVTTMGQIWKLGIFTYIRERSLIIRYCKKFWRFCKRKVQGFEDMLLHVDLGEKANKTVFRLIAVNFIILGVVCAMWLFGWLALMIYSVVLYIVLKKYVQKIQEQYRSLLKATESIAGGNLQTEFDEDWGVFESYKGELIKIQSGFSKAVAEEVKSQKMKTELITNVSHDLKTPLTAITTYIELLKNEDITKEQQKEYLSVLEKKALRLKTLIEDLFEVSKASSGSVALNFQEVDIGNLMRQVYLEYEDKVEDADLIFRFHLPEEKIILKLDSQKTYRIFENLYTNIIKYAMPHTRVYVNLERTEDEIVVELKNMSRVELNIPAESLTERFVRGDSSRNTEGSGLGLAIARSFVELQKGQMKVDIDGDLFKVTLRWNRHIGIHPHRIK